MLSQQQSLQLQSNDKIKALEVELKEVKEDSEHNTTSMNVDSDNKTGSFYTDLREDKKQSSLLKKLFKF
ncbi:hypothetical protein [Macrococcoides caseolyticum]|uniref:hypothetical protein n=1 Tax=Macrococcoides caseolyticum TaxID=69966 RepID=UPI000C32447A|nr:hypothetical protein [Macrococcus caseolyticus]PKD98052.1 hypothetical protein CW719_08920 [Macrococcus caseolyticus]PKE18846.1 hypothetical protein CW679_08545 [Macrococcus caseolyticus]PKF18491.1 hypothetical protein CW717_08920 [Macrococcus caseolyticus]QQB05878.1 hypothetical protein I6H62_01580 [Macrococcus caseolyticus]QYA34285.1 hypothetical protein KYI08_06075 [Macrococcus caseolyticus]